MEKKQEELSNMKEEKDESNKKEIIKTSLKNENSDKVNSKKGNSSETSSSKQNSRKYKTASNKKAKSNLSQASKSKIYIDDYNDNQDRYEEVLKSVKIFENKLENKENSSEEISTFIEDINQTELNEDIKNLKEK